MSIGGYEYWNEYWWLWVLMGYEYIDMSIGGYEFQWVMNIAAPSPTYIKPVQYINSTS